MIFDRYKMTYVNVKILHSVQSCITVLEQFAGEVKKNKDLGFSKAY